MAVARSLLRGALLRCPACGRGRLYARYNTLADRCDRCFVLIDMDAGMWGGAQLLAMAFFGFLALAGWYTMLLAGYRDLRGLAWLLGWGVVAPVLFYPSFKGAWIGLIHASGGLKMPGDDRR